MAEESKDTPFQQIIEGLAQSNGLLGRVAENTQLAAELAIDAIPQMGNGEGDKLTAGIESCLKAIYAHLDEFLGPEYQFNIGMLVPIKHSLDTMSERIKFIMEDVADTKIFVGENLDENRKFHKETGDREKPGEKKGDKKEKEKKITPEQLDKDVRMDAVGLIGDFAKEIKGLISGQAKPERSAARLKGGVKALGGSIMAKLSQENTLTGRTLELGKHFGNRMSGRKDKKPEENSPAAEKTAAETPGAEKTAAETPGAERTAVETLAVKTLMVEKTAGPDAPVGKGNDATAGPDAPVGKGNDADLPGSQIVKTVTGVAKGVGNLAKGVGEVIKDVMVNIAEGVKAFGDAKVLKGAAALLILSASLLVTSKALQEFASVKWEDMAKAGVALLGLAGVATLLGELGPEILEGAAAILALSAATWISAKAFQEFASVDWGSVFEGIAALSLLSIVAAILGVNIEFIALGAAAIALLGIALVPFAVAAAIAGFAMKELADSFTTLSKIDLGSFLKIAAGLEVIGVAAALLGTMSPLILLGAVALGALGVALIPLAAALALAGPNMDTFADGLKKLTDIGGGNLMSVAAGIVAIGAAMAAFGAGQAAAGLGNLVSKFLTLGGDSPVDQLIKIGQAGDGIEKAAAGISNISAAMEGLSKLSKDSMDAINDFPWIRATAFAAVGGQMSAGGVSVGAVSKGGAPDTGAQMNGLQNSTSDANADMSANPIIISGAGGKGSVQNNVSSVTYNSSNIPDRTSWQLTPAYGMGMP
jgi:hypothetical protein